MREDIFVGLEHFVVVLLYIQCICTHNLSLVCAVSSVPLLAANVTDESGMSDDEPEEWRATGRVKKPRSISSKKSDSVKRSINRGVFTRSRYHSVLCAPDENSFFSSFFVFVFFVLFLLLLVVRH